MPNDYGTTERARKFKRAPRGSRSRPQGRGHRTCDKRTRRKRQTQKETNETRETRDEAPQNPRTRSIDDVDYPSTGSSRAASCRASKETTRPLGQPFYLIFEKVREGVTKTSEKSNRYNRSKSPKNLNVRAYPNLRTGTVRTCSHPITKTISRRYQYNNLGDNQTIRRKKGCRRKKGARAQNLGMYLQMTRRVRERVC